MRLKQYSCVLAVVAAFSLAGQTLASETCPKTVGSAHLLGKQFPSSDTWYGSDALAVVVPSNGIWRGMGREHGYRDKLFWWSPGFRPGMESNLTVTAIRIDGESSPATVTRPTNAKIASGPGGWMMLVIIEFPSAGCWEITGRYPGQALSFVVEVFDTELESFDGPGEP